MIGLQLKRNILAAAVSLFDDGQLKGLKALFRQGTAEGVYGSCGSYGLPVLDLSLRTSAVVLEKTGLGRQALLTVLFDPMVEAGKLDPESCGLFDSDTVRLMENLKCVRQLRSQHESVLDENFRKLLVSKAGDIRVIICMIAESYVIMKMAGEKAYSVSEDDRLKITRQTKLLFTPMAHRLGLYAIKSELEDMAVKYEHPDVYHDIARQLAQTKASREAYIDSFIGPVREKLEAAGLKFTIKGRTKSISSIWAKMKAQNTSLDHIYDLFAIRVILDVGPDQEKAQCWHVYSIVTDMYQPNLKRLRDWLSIPKSNGYESLHITVNGPEGRWVEVQIRSKRMDDVAERGLAAHWAYKGIRSEGAADVALAGIREILESGSSDSEMSRSFSMDLYQEEIFVFTPTGEVRQLPKGATVLDFAFSIHTRLGLTCVGAKVGGRNVRISHKLESGDTVQILTQAGQTPKQDWLNIAVTSRARMRIRQGLNEIQNKEAQAGRELLERRFRNRKIEMSESELSHLILRMGYKAQTPFFHALVEQEITVDDVLRQYELMTQAPAQTDTHSAEDFSLEQALQSQGQAGQADELVIDAGLTGIQFRMAGCCHPIYGDSVTGFVSINGGISIHRADCRNLKRMQERYPYRIVRARWSGKSGSQYCITLKVVGQDDIGIVSNMTSVINKEPGTLLRSISIESNDGLFQGQLSVLVSDSNQLKSLIRKIQQVKGVKQVNRID
ncbi:MAG: TGS domain-containing protein [Bacteroidaceae bacterium]|nr:TGS domain-containing protein [Bacteroidaceae bacterium]